MIFWLHSSNVKLNGRQLCLEFTVLCPVNCLVINNCSSAGSLGIVRVFDYSAIALVVILRLIGIYRRRRLNQRVRRLAAVQPEPVNE